MAGEVVRRIPSLSGLYRAEIVRHSSGAYQVEVWHWNEEWVEGHGKVAEFWEPVSRGVTFADTVERAEELARERLVTWEPAGADIA